MPDLTEEFDRWWGRLGADAQTRSVFAAQQRQLAYDAFVAGAAAERAEHEQQAAVVTYPWDDGE